MKFAAVILAFFVMALSILPCEICAEDYETTECQKGARHVDDCSLCCSPFHACGSCAGFILPLSMDVTVPAILAVSQSLDSYHIIQISLHEGTIWQPPKIA